MPTAKTYFVADLHLFAQRSQGHAHLRSMRQLAAQAETFVLGGDIFDFRWSTLGSSAATVAAASAWLTDLTKAAPRCQFHMLLGNHDHHDPFIDALEGLCNRQENLSWHPYFVRMGDSFFLHGDAADRDGTEASLTNARQQAQGHTHRTRGRAASWLYDVAIHAGLHRPVPVFAYPKRRTARRLLSYMNEVGHGPETGVEHVYFGHTHRPMSNYRYRGVKFHNGGAPIKGVGFRIVSAHVRRGKAA
ncbi:MAG: metallophosphoesterase [Planctomycetales bacterium]|nr:metallophosphoesterase [Planctomycetales bacterium]